MAAPFHLVMDLAADNGLDPYARALVDSLRSETWPDDWLITLLLDGRGERDTLYTYRNGTWHALPRSEIASGDPQTLRTLLLQTANVPNAHVPWVVVLWGHGNGWFREGPEGWGQDWSPSGALEWVDGEIREAFLALPRKPDWLFFDACAMAQMEVITAVCPSVHRLGASLGLMPSDGLPWLQALRFARTSRAPVEVWVDSLLLWYERLQAWYPVTYTIWDCEKVTSWLDRWREEAGDPLWAYAEGRMYRDAIRLLPGPSFYRPGLDTLGPVVDLPELLDLLGLSALKDSLAQARIASIGSDSAYGSRRGPGVWRPPSPTSFRSLLQDYLRLKDTFSKSWVAFVQGVWGPDTLPPVWLSPWIPFEQRSREWWGGWGTAKAPLG
ncbi:MAG: clostripain-related cysteine peptidase, partial [Candidatus Hydrothermae bacterium]|nr:clostripain-related cysteine peptidase [Candidatus Hydrothermae bacterium]